LLASTILESLGYQFDVIDSLSNFSRYKLLVLPDAIPVDAKLSEKLEAFLDAGGAILASGSSGFDASKSSVSLKSLGVKLVGPAEHSPDFVSYVLPILLILSLSYSFSSSLSFSLVLFSSLSSLFL
jgi:Beta-galactosidase trimerisation domain